MLRNISSEERWALVSGLQAAQSYQFRVSAVNAVGEGVRSGPSNAVTLPPEPPSGPPESLVGSARSDTSIMIQWQPPAENAQNGRIFGYLVRYRLYGYGHSPWSYRNITNEAQRNYLLQDLITFKDYEIGIAAYNRKGVGVFSDSIRVQTKEGVPEAIPTDVEAFSLNSTAVQVTWTPPDPQKINGINQGYKIFAWKGDPRDKHVFSKGPSLSETVAPSYLNPMEPQTDVISGLDKYTEYHVTVLCFTNPGDGPLSQPVLVRTLQDVPDAVSEFAFENVTDREVVVWWKPPEKPNGVLMGYTLTHMIKDVPTSAIVTNFTADVTNAQITDLKALTHYKFEIVAWTAIGVGESRVAVMQSGVEPVLPEPPTKLGVSNIQAFSVVLQFTPGFDGNSSISKWTAQKGLGSTWEPVFELKQNPNARSLTVENLVPFMNYRLRIVANNVVGPSRPSEPSQPFQTIQAPPKHAPRNVTVRAVSATELRVRWIPLQQIEWYGAPRGYNITYRRLSLRPTSAYDDVNRGNDLRDMGLEMTIRPGSYDDDDQDDWWLHGVKTEHVIVQDQAANSFVLTGLKEFSHYEVIVRAFNDVGSSEPSSSSRDQTRESVPNSGPRKVEAKATSSTTIVVSWTPIEPENENGIILGYKVYYGSKTVPFRYEDIHDNGTFVTTLTELRKYTTYHIQVLGYTRVGDGALSGPPVQLRTFEDLPGEPSNVSFPDVSLSMARIIWDVPAEPNGEILAYRVTYFQHKQPESTNITQELSSTARTLRATDLRPETYYMFAVTAKTNLGWGATAHALVYMTNNRESPQAPSQPQTSPSQVQSRSITFSWTPGRDGFAPLRYYRIEFAEDSTGPWQSIAKRVNPMLTTYTCEELKPFTSYRFRIRAFNDIGPSPWSKSSNLTQTLPDAPERSVEAVRVIPITRTSVRIEWSPLAKSDWNGDLKSGGYRILYRQVNHFPSISHNVQQEEIHDIERSRSSSVESLSKAFAEADKMVLNDLIRDRNYEMQVLGFNAQGAGPASSPLTVWVGEAVPTGEPRHVTAVATSPHQVSLTWLAPRENQQNGDLLGYKIFYKNEDKPDHEEEVEVVPAATTAHMLLFMDTYTTYTIHILAFNAAGDGPRSLPVSVKTQQRYVMRRLQETKLYEASHFVRLLCSKSILDEDKSMTCIFKKLSNLSCFNERLLMMTMFLVFQGLPGPPGPLLFSEITMTSVQVSWNPPEKPNGEIQYYSVIYKTAEPNDNFSKEVKQRVQEPYWLVTDLDEGIAYTFTVRAFTIGDGPPSEANITTGPQDGSPSAIENLSVRETLSAFSLSWTNGRSGRGPILGYLIQAKRKGDHQWETVSRTTQGPVESYSIPYGNLQPASWYWFRVMSYNAFGVSPAATMSNPLATPAKAYGFTAQPPFYRRPEFLVVVAAGGVVLLITVIAVLCVKSKTYKYKGELGFSGFDLDLAEEANKTHDESLSMDGGESGFGSLGGMRQSRRKNSISKMRASIVRHGQSLSGTLGSVRNGMGSLRRPGTSQAPLGKLPPRPRPASVTYSDDDSSSVKGYDPNPDDEESELTEKPSELSTTDSQATESDGESENSHPHSFVNHYANVNDTLRQTWKREARPAPPPPPPSAVATAAGPGVAGPSGINQPSTSSAAMQHHVLPPYQPGPSNYHLHQHTSPRPPSGANTIQSQPDPYSLHPPHQHHVQQQQQQQQQQQPQQLYHHQHPSVIGPPSTTAPAQLNPATLRAHTRAMGQNQLHGPPRNYSSFTESEQEGSTVMSLNGGQIVLNNMAGSRAPLPGFSSFV
ncbi:unnamed protein product [Notodromas monacha]|uniref:Fibronectin type-III domain-containing protein n=1 Tax=Notodromas monacha TaxID=399045 RepID=A0A7R9GHV2_9CRUS|nr:unnamed protein product [Notodromas monacha]CAG0921735.1 unnamed protein product [Notodromas monacha]